VLEAPSSYKTKVFACTALEVPLLTSSLTMPNSLSTDLKWKRKNPGRSKRALKSRRVTSPIDLPRTVDMKGVTEREVK